MDFFEYFNNILLFFGDRLMLLPILLIAGGLYLLTYIPEAIGLYAIAKAQEDKRRFLAFVPFGNTYLLGALAEPGNFLSAKIKRVGLWTMLSEILSFAVGALWFTQLMLLTPYVELNNITEAYEYVNVPANLAWCAKSVDYVAYAVQLFNLIYIVFLAVALIAFFRKYYYRSAIPMSIFALFIPISKGFLIFAVRKNKPVDYEAMMRAQQEAFRRQSYGNPYGNPYNNPYGDPNRTAGQPDKQEPPDPFEEFGKPADKPADQDGAKKGNDNPFDDFSD